MRKGQFLSADIFIASVVFVGILVLALFAWDFAKAKSDEVDLRRDMTLSSRSALSALLLTPGEPAGWEDLSSLNTTSLSSLGLASEPYVISMAKGQRLVSGNASSYDAYRTALGLSAYQFQLRIYQFRGNTYSTSAIISAGKAPPSNATELIVLERTALMNGSAAKLTLEVWRNG